MNDKRTICMNEKQQKHDFLFNWVNVYQNKVDTVISDCFKRKTLKRKVDVLLLTGMMFRAKALRQNVRRVHGDLLFLTRN